MYFGFECKIRQKRSVREKSTCKHGLRDGNKVLAKGRRIRYIVKAFRERRKIIKEGLKK